MALDDAHDLIPAEIAADIPKLYATEKEEDPVALVKLFTPDSSWTWYLTEYDPKRKLAFGLTDGHERELGYVSIEELEEITGPMGLKVERDVHWEPRRLSEIDEPGRGWRDRTPGTDPSGPRR